MTALATRELTYEQSQALAKIAQSDMRLARKQGSLLIANTRFGTIQLSYTKENRSYRIVTCDPFAVRKIGIKNMAASGCEMRLVYIYDIQFQD